MTDTTWGDETLPPKPKRIPTWLWFCGGGCILAVILAVVAGVFAFDYFKGWGSPEKQLPALAEALPFDEPLPPETEFQMAIRFPFDWFVFTDDRGFALVFIVVPPSQASEIRDTILNPEFKGGFMGNGNREGLEEAIVEVQGREVRGLRYVQHGAGGGQAGSGEGPGIVLDIGPESGGKMIVVQILRSGGEEKITDDEVRELLKPFHVGPDR
jgi:hypothetical protein